MDYPEWIPRVGSMIDLYGSRLIVVALTESPDSPFLARVHFYPWLDDEVDYIDVPVVATDLCEPEWAAEAMFYSATDWTRWRMSTYCECWECRHPEHLEE